MTRERRAELISKYARQFQLQIEGKARKAVTLSFGIAIFPGNGTTTEEILRSADTALYRAKRQGRGRIVMAV